MGFRDEEVIWILKKNKELEKRVELLEAKKIE